jgi:DNA-binding NarL/FixJ family response regulator
MSTKPSARAFDPPTQAEDTQAMLRVLVVSDVRLFREGISSVLANEGGVSVIGTADVPHAQVRTSELQPDVVMFDATRRESVEHARNLAAVVPDTKIVAFGVAETQDEILALAAAGTAGYVRDDAEAKEVVDVLARVMRDELLCSPQATASLYHQVALLSHEGSGTASIDLLSRRERQVAHLIDRGLSNKQIARKLEIEATTVKNHVHHILDKLKVHRRAEAIARFRTSLRSFEVPFADDPGPPGSRLKTR